MVTIRAIAPDEAGWFAALAGGDDDGYEQRLRGQLEAGQTRLDWCLVAASGEGVAVGRATVVRDDAEPHLESWLRGLWLRWGEDDQEVGVLLLRAVAALEPSVGVPIDARVNPESHPAPERGRRVLEAAGFGLFQEKAGFTWTDDGTPVRVPDRLTFRPLPEVGEDAFSAALSAGCAATLDRNDSYFYDLVGAERWGREMMGYLEPADEGTWWLAYDDAGQLVGYVMLSAFDEEGVGTIAHIGVVPAQRGRGYAGDLLSRANAGAQDRGFTSILSDVDVQNPPMMAAMERAGHHAGVRPWHVWHYRWPPPDPGASSSTSLAGSTSGSG